MRSRLGWGVSIDWRDRSKGCDGTYLGLCVGLGNVTIVQNRNQCAVRALE
jgi:hypothetical protein